MDKMFLPALLRIDQLTQRNLCCVLISHVPYENFVGAAATRPIVRLDFPPYSRPQLTDILCLSCPDPALLEGYKEMIKLILTVFLDQYREVLELEQVAATAWPLVKDAIESGQVAAGNSADVAKIYRLIKPVLRQVHVYGICTKKCIWNMYCEILKSQPPITPAR